MLPGTVPAETQADKGLEIWALSVRAFTVHGCDAKKSEKNIETVGVQSDLFPSPGCDDNVVEEIVGSLNLVPVEKMALVTQKMGAYHRGLFSCIVISQMKG